MCTHIDLYTCGYNYSVKDEIDTDMYLHDQHVCIYNHSVSREIETDMCIHRPT